LLMEDENIEYRKTLVMGDVEREYIVTDKRLIIYERRSGIAKKEVKIEDYDLGYVSKAWYGYVRDLRRLLVGVLFLLVAVFLFYQSMVYETMWWFGGLASQFRGYAFIAVLMGILLVVSGIKRHYEIRLQHTEVGEIKLRSKDPAIVEFAAFLRNYLMKRKSLHQIA